MPRTVHIVVEDLLSQAVLTRLLREAPGRPIVGNVFPLKRAWNPDSGPNGYGYIRKNLPGFNAAALTGSYVLLIDLDDNECAPTLIAKWRGNLVLNPGLVLRVAVREVEAWLIGDSEGLAAALHLSRHCFPRDPERINDPKRYIVRHAARSRLAEIRNDVSPALDSSGQTGPLYTRFLSAFVQNLWDVDEATKRCKSLQRTRRAIAKL